MIWRADDLAAVMTELARGFGGVRVTPVYPDANRPAIRILVSAITGSRAPLQIEPGILIAAVDRAAKP
jgi:tRNA1(Val) A37 N6-methylase TrmN6